MMLSVIISGALNTKFFIDLSIFKMTHMNTSAYDNSPLLSISLK